MKYLIFLCCLVVVLSIELRFTSHPVDVIFKKGHRISKIERFKKNSVDLNVDNLKNHTELIKENIHGIIEFFAKQRVTIKCELLEIFLYV